MILKRGIEVLVQTPSPKPATTALEEVRLAEKLGVPVTVQSHHTYTNLAGAGADDDIDFVPFARLSPGQPRYRIHRFQQLYLWPLDRFLF